MNGVLGAQVIRRPQVGWRWKLRNSANIWRGLWRAAVAEALGVPHMRATLRALLIRRDGRVMDYGLVSTRVVTTAFANFVVDQLQTETSAFGDFKYHDTGIGVGDEAAGDTGMGTVSTEMTDDLRVAGTQVEGASANIYRSVATVSYTGSEAITEHGLFNDTRANGGTLMDRSKFAAINVGNGDSIQFTYELTVSAGG